jgi:hypothetical protein
MYLESLLFINFFQVCEFHNFRSNVTTCIIYIFYFHAIPSKIIHPPNDFFFLHVYTREGRGKIRINDLYFMKRGP